MVAAAVVGSAVVGAGASSISASKAAKAQKKAASQANDTTLAQLAQQQKQYDQDRADLAPYRTVGNNALYSLGNLLGLDTVAPASAPQSPAPASSPGAGSVNWGAYVNGNPDALANWNVVKNSKAGKQFGGDINAFGQYHYNLDGARRDLTPYTTPSQQQATAQTQASQAMAASDPAERGLLNKTFSLADFNADPGYQFRQDEGRRALESSASARGGILSGGAMKALERYSQGVASDEYGAAYSRFNNDQTTRFNRLASIAGVGQQATNSGIAAGANNQSAQAAGASQIANNTLSAGNARASQYVAQGNAIGGAVGQVGNYFALRDLYNPAMTTAGTPPIYGGNLGGIY